MDTNLDRAEAFARETGAEPFADFDQALQQSEFDAVDLMLPHDLHEPFAMASFEAGKHLLLEKPLAPTLSACDRILAAARKSDKVFMVAENAQYWPEIVKAKELIEAGAIGEIITARAAFVMAFDKRWFPDEKPWRFELERTGGGITIDGGSHWIRPLRMWLGEIDEVVGVTDRPLSAMEGESLGACPSNGALRGERRGQRRFEIQMVNFEKFHAAKQHQARLLGEPNPALGS